MGSSAVFRNAVAQPAAGVVTTALPSGARHERPRATIRSRQTDPQATQLRGPPCHSPAAGYERPTQRELLRRRSIALSARACPRSHLSGAGHRPEVGAYRANSPAQSHRRRHRIPLVRAGGSVIGRADGRLPNESSHMSDAAQGRSTQKRARHMPRRLGSTKRQSSASNFRPGPFGAIAARTRPTAAASSRVVSCCSKRCSTPWVNACSSLASAYHMPTGWPSWRSTHAKNMAPFSRRSRLRPRHSPQFDQVVLAFGDVAGIEQP